MYSHDISCTANKEKQTANEMKSRFSVVASATQWSPPMRSIEPPAGTDAAPVAAWALMRIQKSGFGSLDIGKRFCHVNLCKCMLIYVILC